MFDCPVVSPDDFSDRVVRGDIARAHGARRKSPPMVQETSDDRVRVGQKGHEARPLDGERHGLLLAR